MVTITNYLDVLPIPGEPRPTTIAGREATMQIGTYQQIDHIVAVRFTDTLGVTVQNANQTVTRAILDSMRFVDVDHAGCRTKAPALARIQMHRLQPSKARLGRPRAIRLCYYGAGLHGASATLTGRALQRLVRAVNAAGPGANPDQRGCGSRPESVAVVRALASYSGRHPLRLTFQTDGCVNRGVARNNRTVSQVTWPVMGSLRRALALSFDVTRLPLH